MIRSSAAAAEIEAIFLMKQRKSVIVMLYGKNRRTCASVPLSTRRQLHDQRSIQFRWMTATATAHISPANTRAKSTPLNGPNFNANLGKPEATPSSPQLLNT